MAPRSREPSAPRRAAQHAIAPVVESQDIDEVLAEREDLEQTVDVLAVPADVHRQGVLELGTTFLFDPKGFRLLDNEV